MSVVAWARRILLLGFVAAAAHAATLVRQPYLQNVRPDAATVLWTTVEPGDGRVEYWVDGQQWRSAPASLQAYSAPETGLGFDYYQYRAELTGLIPESSYRYRVLVDEQPLADGESFRFRTTGPGPFRFLVFGDSGTGDADQLRLAESITREDPVLVLHTGDVAQYVGTFKEYEDYYFAPYGPLMARAPFFPVPGNHDYLTGKALPYMAGHAPPSSGVAAGDRGRYYSFDWGDAHFVALDTNTPLVQAVDGVGPMLEWLENDLRSTRCFWRIVYFHHGAYPAGPHMGEVLAEYVRKLVTPILERYGVQVAFNGHEHFYMRTHPLIGGARSASGTGTVYVTTGGGGGFLHTASNQPFVAFYESAYHYLRCELEGPRLTIQAVAGDGREIDRYTLAPAPQLQAGSVVNSATFKPSMAPGGLVSIFGLALGSGERAARTLPLPQELSATTVSLAGVRIPLLYVSATQINAQLPFGFQGRQTLIVTTPNGSAQTEIDAAPTAPAVFTVYPPQGAVAAVVHTSGALVSAGAPAAPGEVVSVYLTGLGWVQGGVQEGQAAPVFPLARTVATVEAMLAGRALATAYAGLAPGFAGLYQVNVKIPEDIAPGSYPLRIVAEAVASDPVSLPVGY